jgi:hypothetical protein
MIANIRIDDFKVLGVDDETNKKHRERMVFYNNKPIFIRNEIDIKNFFNDYDKKFNEGFLISLGKGNSSISYMSCESMVIVLYQTKQTKVHGYIKSPEYIGRGVINIKNLDDMCFKYCMRYHKTERGNHDDRITTLKKKVDIYNYEGIKFPLDICDLEIFENNNKNVNISVFKIDNNNLVLYYESKNESNDIVNLLILEEDEKCHITYVKSMGKIIKNQSELFGNHKVNVCNKCLVFYDGRYNHKCKKK